MSAAASAGWRAVYFVKLRTVASFPSQCGRTKALPRREESGARRTRSGGGSGTWEGGRDRLLSSPGDQQQERTGRGSKEGRGIAVTKASKELEEEEEEDQE